MAQHDIGSLVVMDHGQMLGMLTFAEVLQALSKRQGQLGDLKVSEIYDARSADRHARPRRDGAAPRPCSSVTRATSRCRTAATLLGVVSFHDVAKAVYEEQSFENRMLKSYIKNWPDEETE